MELGNMKISMRLGLGFTKNAIGMPSQIFKTIVGNIKGSAITSPKAASGDSDVDTLAQSENDILSKNLRALIRTCGSGGRGIRPL